MGSIVWQLNDCWPVTSWAAVDGNGRRKLLWFALRAAFADRVVTIQPRDGTLAVVLVNDLDESWRTRVTVVRHGLDGSVRATFAADVHVPPRSAMTTTIDPDVATSAAPEAELLRADADGLRTHWFFAEDKAVDYPQARWATSVQGNRLTVTAATVVRDLTLFPDRLSADAAADIAMVTLLPGESATFTVSGLAPDALRGVDGAPVLRAVNDLSVRT
jgi:beta-mannosidase